MPKEKVVPANLRIVCKVQGLGPVLTRIIRVSLRILQNGMIASVPEAASVFQM